MAKAIEQVNGFVQQYNEKLAELNTKVKQVYQEIEDTQIELQFVQENEIPKATERRVLQGDALEEAKVKKLENKLKDQLESKQEELIVLNRVIDRFVQSEADKVTDSDLQRLFNQEKVVFETEVFDRIAKDKQLYLQAMETESRILHDYKNTDSALQNILVQAGRKPNVNASIEIPHTRDFTIDRNNVIKVIKN